jgi:hypothetical protein
VLARCKASSNSIAAKPTLAVGYPKSHRRRKRWSPNGLAPGARGGDNDSLGRRPPGLFGIALKDVALMKAQRSLRGQIGCGGPPEAASRWRCGHCPHRRRLDVCGLKGLLKNATSTHIRKRPAQERAGRFFAMFNRCFSRDCRPCSGVPNPSSSTYPDYYPRTPVLRYPSERRAPAGQKRAFSRLASIRCCSPR